MKKRPGTFARRGTLWKKNQGGNFPGKDWGKNQTLKEVSTRSLERGHVAKQGKDKENKGTKQKFAMAWR